MHHAVAVFVLLLAGFHPAFAYCDTWRYDSIAGDVTVINSHTILTASSPAAQFLWDQPTPNPDYSVDLMYNQSRFNSGAGRAFGSFFNGNTWDPATHDNSDNGLNFQLAGPFNNVDKLVLLNDLNFSSAKSDGAKDIRIKLYDSSNSLLGTHSFTALNSGGRQIFSFGQTYNDVASFDFMVDTTYTRVPLQIAEVALGSDTALDCNLLSSLEVSKTATASVFTTGKMKELPAGTVVTYNYVITTTGQTTLNNVIINDVHNGENTPPVPDIENASLVDNGTLGDSTNTTSNGTWDFLGPGDSLTITADYTVSVDDIVLHQ